MQIVMYKKGRACQDRRLKIAFKLIFIANVVTSSLTWRAEVNFRYFPVDEGLTSNLFCTRFLFVPTNRVI